jgi:hypothetical protein
VCVRGWANLKPRCTNVAYASGMSPKTSILGISVAVIVTDKRGLDNSADGSRENKE